LKCINGSQKGRALCSADCRHSWFELSNRSQMLGRCSIDCTVGSNRVPKRYKA